MTPEEIEARAQALYEALSVPRPRWAQLGEATRSVWRERAAQESSRQCDAET